MSSISSSSYNFISPEDITTPVLEQATNAQQFAQSIQTTSLAAIESLGDMTVLSINDSGLFDFVTEGLFDIDNAGLAGIEVTAPEKPTRNEIVISDPQTVIGTVDPLDLSDLENINTETPPYTVERPNISFMDMPDEEFPTFTKEAPALSEILIPSKPISKDDLPDIPKISDISIPAPPEFKDYTFDGVAPVDTLKAPDAMFVHNEAEYDSDIKRQLESDLLQRLIDGGTGLDVDTEAAIWARAQERQKVENDEAYQRELNFFSSRGFSLPPGQLNAKLRAVQSRIDQKNQDLNNDILVQSSNLAQNNTQFIITQAIQLEKNLMDNANQVATRAFETAKATIQFIHEQFQLELSHLGVKWDGYKALAQVYEVKIRGEVSKAEFYKAQIQGIEAGIRVDALLVQAYDSTIKGISTLIQMYATEMEAAKIQSEIDLNKLKGYQTEADVYAQKVDAITSQYTARQIQIAGEAEKVKLYLADNQAYETMVNAQKSIVETALTKAEIKLKGHQADIETLRIALEKYKTESAHILAQADTEIKAAGLDVEIFKSETAQYEAEIDAIIKDYLGRVEAAKAEGDLQIKEAEIALQKMLGEKGLTSEQIIALSRIAGQLGAAALTSTSVSSNIGLSTTRSQSETSSESDSYSRTCSVSNTTNYQGEGSGPSCA